MIRELTLKNFKSFGRRSLPPSPKGHMRLNPRGWVGETIRFGRLSLLIGTNASGKSNVRDGLRFLHGLSRQGPSRHYTLAEVIGEKYGEGGELQWKGIRGGVQEIITRNGKGAESMFAVAVKTDLLAEDGGGEATYRIEVRVGDAPRTPVVIGESLAVKKQEKTHSCFTMRPWKAPPGKMKVVLWPWSEAGQLKSVRRTLRNDQPALTQILDWEDPNSKGGPEPVQRACKAFLRTISSVRFLDPDPNLLRRPSSPGQTILGEKGENLSSVLQTMCADPRAKETLVEWAKELLPQDVVDLGFPTVSLEGKVQLQITEPGGRRISAESASDGTLRFLAFAAAMLGTAPARFYFLEEIENGIHPNRAHSLVSLLRTATRDGRIQVVGTTHSPALLNSLDLETLKEAALLYRVGGVSEIRQLADIPALEAVLPQARAGELQSAGWFEDVVAFGHGGQKP